MRQATVYREPGRFAGWPANYGIWAWGAEIVVGFTVGAHRTVERGHAIDKRQPFVNMQARSLDGGETWQIEDFNGTRPGGRGLSADEHMATGLRLSELVDESTAEIPAQPLDFSQSDFALMAARTGIGRGVVSFFYVSDDRCRSWAGPLPPAAVRADGHRRPHGLHHPGRAFGAFLPDRQQSRWRGRQGHLRSQRRRRPILRASFRGRRRTGRTRRFRHHARGAATALRPHSLRAPLPRWRHATELDRPLRLG